MAELEAIENENAEDTASSEIGNWGSVITFEVSGDKVLTFNGFSRSTSSRWKDHMIINGKPRSEFAGPGLSDQTFNVVLSAAEGVNPREMLEALEKAAEEGTVDYLFIGGKKVGENKVKLESVSESWDMILNKGELVKATVSLTFSEYVEPGGIISAEIDGETKVPWEYRVKDEVQFTQSRYWTKATKKGKKKKCKPGKAKITKYQKKKKHPWCLKSTDKNKKKKVAGWVNDGDFV